MTGEVRFLRGVQLLYMLFEFHRSDRSDLYEKVLTGEVMQKKGE